MALGTDQMTITTGTIFIPEVWALEVLRATEEALVAAPLVKRYDSLVQNKGDTIHIPELSNLTANDKAANTQVTLQAPAETETTISIDKHKETSFLVEDILKVQSNIDLMSEYTQKAKPTKTGLLKPNLITGTAEMPTRRKQEKSVQPQRLSDSGSLMEYATVRTYMN